MIEMEICLNTDDLSLLKKNVLAVRNGGASRIELCSAMHHQGLTPELSAVSIARNAWGLTSGVLAMIRPRAGDFNYSCSEVELMKQQIINVAQAGADGVVFGILENNSEINIKAMEYLISLCNQMKLSVTCHRAIDACIDPLKAWENLQQLGVSRILTAGSPWGSNKSALHGADIFHKYLHLNNTYCNAGKDISSPLKKRAPELVIGGGINADAIEHIVNSINIENSSVSFHSYSAILNHNEVDTLKVRSFVELANRCVKN